MTPLDWVFTVGSIALIAIVGIFKPAIALKQRKKMENWLEKKKKYHKDNKTNIRWWKKSFYPFFVFYLWLSRISTKFIKKEHWAAALFYGLGWFLFGIILIFLFAIASALVIGALIIAGTILFMFILWNLFKDFISNDMNSSGFSSGYNKATSSPFFSKDAKTSTIGKNLSGEEIISDNEGGETRKTKDMAGNDYLVNEGGEKWRKGKDFSGTEFYTDDKGTKWYKTKDMTGTEYWEDYKSGEKIRVGKNYSGDKKYIKE